MKTNTYKKIFIPTEKPENWQQLLAEPIKHWKTGHSARTLAYCWQEANGIPTDVVSILQQHAEFNGIEALIIIPEHQVPLPGGTRPSQNDCWVLASASNDLISIAVEGKVSEPFGPTIFEWLKDASDGKKERLSALCSHIGLTAPLPDNMRYQLLHRTASAVIEAKRFHARHAVMLVHSFSQSAEWFDDYAQFVTLLGATAEKNKIISVGPINGVHLHLAWVCGDARYLTL